MAGRIPDETLQAIRDRTSLVEVVSSYVKLRKSGRNYVGLCPFHSEKTPSFTVNEERGLFHCFGCGAGGTVFTFLMRAERIEFAEAVAQLARRAGVMLPQSGEGGAEGGERERLYEVNAQAQEFFQQQFARPVGASARRYLSGRGLAAATMERYGIGFAPAGGTALLRWLASRKVPVELALRVGLAARRSDGSLYDVFRGRVMFPIRDRRGRVAGFGGRTLGDEQPKYLNSSDSPVFRKGESVYGLAEAREAVRKNERVVLVEGYMDALLLVQEGIPYTVAVLGTALTASQLRLLRPFGGEQLTVFFFFDGDEAGRRAALRAFGVCVEADVWGKAVFLPQGFDPDSFIRARGLSATLTLLENALPLADFYLDSIAPAGASLPQRARAGEEVARVIARARSDVRFELLARQAAQRLGLSEDIFRAARRGAVLESPMRRAVQAQGAWPPAEIQLLEAMVASSEVALHVGEQGTLGSFTHAELARIGERIVSAAREGHGPSFDVDDLPAPLVERLTAVVFGGGPMAHADAAEVARDCIARIERDARCRERRRIAAELRQAEGRGEEDQSYRKLASLNEMLRREGGAA